MSSVVVAKTMHQCGHFDANQRQTIPGISCWAGCKAVLLVKHGTAVTDKEPVLITLSISRFWVLDGRIMFGIRTEPGLPASVWAVKAWFGLQTSTCHIQPCSQAASYIAAMVSGELTG